MRGINTTLHKITAFWIAAFLTGIVGGMWAFQNTFIDPDIVFFESRTVELVMMTMLGGLGTVAGPVIGAAIIYWLRDVVWANFLAVSSHRRRACCSSSSCSSCRKASWARWAIAPAPASAGSGGVFLSSGARSDEAEVQLMMTPTSEIAPLLEGRNVSKYFGGLAALNARRLRRLSRRDDGADRAQRQRQDDAF